MIYYVTSGWGLLYIFRLRGSVLPKAFIWAFPSAAVAVILKHYEVNFNLEGVQEMWGGFTFVLGFMTVFRNNQAYMRFWEGATLIQQVRGEWFNAVSSLIAFCNHAKAKKDQVEEFQHLLVRLMSMLYCCALQQVAVVDDNNFEIIDNAGLDQESLIHLANSVDRCEIILQWVQRLIVDAHNTGILQISAPILSRSFQELSRGIVNLNNVRKIKEIPLPFPYSQASMVMLLVHWLFTPLFASQTINSIWCVGFTSFITSAAFWSLNYIAQEIEQPFGEDPNDLPIAEMQMDMNRSLCVLLHPKTQIPPRFRYIKARDTSMLTRPSDLDLMCYDDDQEEPAALEPVYESEDCCDGVGDDSYAVYPSAMSDRERDRERDRDREKVRESNISHKASVVSRVHSIVTRPSTASRTSARSMGTSRTKASHDRNSIASDQTMFSKLSDMSVFTVRSNMTSKSAKSGRSVLPSKKESAYAKMVRRERAKVKARTLARSCSAWRLSEGTIGEKKNVNNVNGTPSLTLGRLHTSDSFGTTITEDPTENEVAEETDKTAPAMHVHGISRGGIEGQRASLKGLHQLLATPPFASAGALHERPRSPNTTQNGLTPLTPTTPTRGRGDRGDNSLISHETSDIPASTRVIAAGDLREGGVT